MLSIRADITFILVWLTSVGQGQRLHVAPELQPRRSLEQRSASRVKELANLFLFLNPVAAFAHPPLGKRFHVSSERAARSLRNSALAKFGRLPVTYMRELAHHTNLNLKGKEELQREVLDARLRTLGPDHPDTLGIKSSLAKTLQRRGDMKGAEELQQQVVEAHMRALGPHHPDTLTSKSSLAEILKASGDFKGVERLHREVFDAKKGSLGPDHADTVQSKRDLAFSLQNLGDHKSAELLQREVLEVMEECMPDEEPLHPAVRRFNQVLLDVIKGGIDTIYQGRNIQRFYVLECLARVPYFAFLSCLHLYESLGMRERTRLMRTHYAEADNELHHLLIMESLGGDEAFIDRFIAQHMAFFYYWYNVAIYLFIPKAAYHMSELIEAHAFKTYTTFLDENAEKLKKLPVPDIARQYYGGRDKLRSYLHEDEQTAPALNNLYDVFMHVRNDEGDHWRTLVNLVQHDDIDGLEGCPIVGTDMLPR